MNKKVTTMMFLISALSFAAPISKIVIENNQFVPSQLILSNIKMQEGAEFDKDVLANDFKRLNETKYFDNVKINPVETSKGVEIKISVMEKADIANILKSEGVLNAVNNETEFTNDFVLADIKVEGNSKISGQQILEMSGLKKGSPINDKQLQEAQNRILQSGQFQSIRIKKAENQKNVYVIIEVAELQEVKNVVVTGSQIFNNDELTKLFIREDGKALTIEDIKVSSEKLKQLYASQGFVLAGISSVNVDENGVMHIKVVEAKVRKIEAKKMVVKQKGNRRLPNDDVLKTKDYVIDREIVIRPGEIFNIKAYDQTVNNLMRLGIFRNIKFEARPVAGSDDLVDIVLLIDEDRTATFHGGVSYGTQSGWMGTVSLKDNNWNGQNQEVSISYEKSTKSFANFNLSFYDPWIKDTKGISWGWGLYRNTYGTQSPIFNRTKVLGGRFNIGKGINRNASLNIGAKFEHINEYPAEGAFTINQDDPTKGTYIDSEDKTKKPKVAEGLNDTYYLASLHPYVIYDTRNNRINATSGVYAKLQVEAGYVSGYKQGFFTNTTADLRYYHKGLFEKNNFAYRLQAGYMSQNTKEAQKYWVGGGNSLRGFDNGFFRGNKKLTFTAENRTTINDYVGVVLFVDAGRAWDYSLPNLPNGRDIPEYYKNDTNLYGQLAIGAGVGLNFNTPIGPIRFDLGWPIYGKDKDKEDGTIKDVKKEMKFYFNMGHSF